MYSSLSQNNSKNLDGGGNCLYGQVTIVIVELVESGDYRFHCPEMLEKAVF